MTFKAKNIKKQMRINQKDGEENENIMEKMYEIIILMKNIRIKMSILFLNRLVSLKRYINPSPAFIQSPPRVAPKPSPPNM